MKWTTLGGLTLLVSLLAACAAPAAIPAATPAATPTGGAPAAQAPTADRATPQPEPSTRPPAVGTEFYESESADDLLTPTPAAALPPSLSRGEQALADQARADLAQRLNVAPDQIELLSFEAVTWPNGALGCSQPGMAYTEALVDGARLTLAFGGQSYAYHSGGTRPPFLCENPD